MAPNDLCIGFASDCFHNTGGLLSGVPSALAALAALAHQTLWQQTSGGWYSWARGFEWMIWTKSLQSKLTLKITFVEAFVLFFYIFDFFFALFLALPSFRLNFQSSASQSTSQIIVWTPLKIRIRDIETPRSHRSSIERLPETRLGTSRWSGKLLNHSSCKILHGPSPSKSTGLDLLLL